MPEKKERPKMEFATNVPADVVLGKNFKSGTGEYGAWHGWNLIHDGEEKVVFAKDALHDKIKGFPEHAKLRIVYAEKKGETGKYNEWEVSPLNGTAKIAAAQPALKPDVETERHDTAHFQDHLLACSDVAILVAERLGLVSDESRQACFATVCIDAQRRAVVLGNGHTVPVENDATAATPDQKKAIANLCKVLKIASAKPIFADAGCVDPAALTSVQAGKVIELLQQQYDDRPE